MSYDSINYALDQYLKSAVDQNGFIKMTHDFGILNGKVSYNEES